MTLADKVTSIRIILAPVFFFVYNFYSFFFPKLSTPSGFWQYWQIPTLWIIFIVAELTDFFDGRIARKQNKASDFGKFFDPFADTIMQVTLFFCFVCNAILPVIPLLLILYREFGILFIRNLMQKKGISMGARIGGKIKTVAYITTAILALLVFSVRSLNALLPVPPSILFRLQPVLSQTAIVAFWIAVVLSLVSFADYVRVYRKSGPA
jgi:CDP-diacylglycerol--glycerol-3-phosphate 3-phosphatidyltransferase